MPNHIYDSLPIAIRIYPETDRPRKESRAPKKWVRPRGMLVFDAETRVDAAQALTFGSFRVFWDGRCLKEGLFYGEVLEDKERHVLDEYVAAHQAETVHQSNLELLSRREFVDLLFELAYRRRYLTVAFNMPFDLSRVAFEFTKARGRFAGGFALELWSYINNLGHEVPDPNRPRICIKHIDSKRALKGFTSRRIPDPADLIPDDSETGEPEPGFKFRGHLLDLRTLAFALTDKGHTLESASEAFGGEKKQKPKSHGIVTEEYIYYNRQDVHITCKLALNLLEEYEKHPITLQPTKAYSPASIGKAYLQTMGIPPILEWQPDFPREYLGYAETAFVGGRTSAHIRKISVPVVYTDFLSMYPTVNNLMGLWSFVIAREVKVVEHCESEIIRFLTKLEPEDLFKPQMWKSLGGFVKVIPGGDILPCRAKYSVESNDWQVGVNHVYVEKTSASDLVPNPKAFWYSLPDVVASVILTRRIPNIVDAFRIVPVAVLDGLKAIRLRGEIGIDPASEDFFKAVIEQRKRVASRNDIDEAKKERLGGALKVLANSTSYGIYAEMNREESDDPVRVTCHGIDEEPFSCSVGHPDIPGKYCFPPLASLITGGARLMLALLEYSVTKRGGTYAMEDTDSMAIVATETGGKIRCPGGPHLMDDGRDGVLALSWNQVDEIVEQFAALNPYDPAAVGRSILKIEKDNWDPETGKRRQLYCHAISAKRYVLFERNEDCGPAVLRKKINSEKDHWSQHGLGHLLNPTDLDSDDRDWIAQVWENIIRAADGFPVAKLSFEDFPAVGRVSVSSPGMMKLFADFNRGKKYSEQIKPFNFLLTCHVKPFGHPAGADPEHFHLIAPYETDPQKWLKMLWIDQYTGKKYRITTEGHHGARDAARVKTYGDVIREYACHPESKCADDVGNICDRVTIGLLQRRHILIDGVTAIGKESNKLEEVDAGMVHDPDAAYTVYRDPRRDEWETKIRPALQKMSLSGLVEKTGMSPRALIDLREGRSRPHAKHKEAILAVLRKLSLL